MLCCKKISVTQFKNYTYNTFEFKEKIIAVSGKNGSGKTNLLDSVYYLCFTRSYFAKPEIQNVKKDFAGFRIEGEFVLHDDIHTLLCILRENGKKEIILDEDVYTRFSKHIGKFPCVMIAPDDVSMITGGSEERRKFVDIILSQLNAEYLSALNRYNKIVLQRNSLLKASASKLTDESLLKVLDTQLMESGDYIFKERKAFFSAFLPLVLSEYKAIASSDEAITISYNSQLLHAPFDVLLKEHRQRDLYLQRTTSGIHKDDIDIEMNGSLFKTISSQGQRKSLLFALKLSEFEVLKKHKGFAPILLLDDVFEKLDENRMVKLLKRVCIDENAQVFITDTHQERLDSAFEGMQVPYQLVEL